MVWLYHSMLTTAKRSMLAQLAQSIRRRRAGEGDMGDEEGGGLGAMGGRIVLGDDCTVM